MSELASSPSSDVKLTRVFSRTPSSWDPQDDLLLRHLKEEQKLGWKEISSHFAHRTPNACQFRWRRLRSGSLKNGTNSPTPSSNASTPNPVSNINTTNTAINDDTGDSSSSNSPPPIINSKIQEPLVTKFSSIPSKAKDKKQISTTTPINVPVYNQWSFHSSTRSSSNQSNLSKRINKDSHDPLSASLNSLDDSESDIDDDVNSSVLIDSKRNDVFLDWTSDEDELLLTRRKRSLSFAELSILLPSRTEHEILNRIDELDKKNITTKIKTTRSNSARSHNHPYPLHTASHIINSPIISSPSMTYTPTMFQRSYSSSSQTSLSTTTPTLGTTGTLSSQFFMSGDSARSKSFSYITPYIQSTDRYKLRKDSITNSIHESRTRSNSFLQSQHPSSNLQNTMTGKNDSSSSELDENDDQLKIEPKLPPLGTIFNDLYSR